MADLPEIPDNQLDVDNPIFATPNGSGGELDENVQVLSLQSLDYHVKRLCEVQHNTARTMGQMIINAQNEYEQNIFSQDNDESLFLNRLISQSEVSNILCNTKNGKAVGIDMLPYEVLRNEGLLKVLTEFFNKCFTTSVYHLYGAKQQ